MNSIETQKLRVSKHCGFWHVGTFVPESNLGPMWIADNYRTKRAALSRLHSLQSLLSTQGKASQADIYSISGKHQQTINVPANKESAS